MNFGWLIDRTIWVISFKVENCQIMPFAFVE